MGAYTQGADKLNETYTNLTSPLIRQGQRRDSGIEPQKQDSAAKVLSAPCTV